MPSLSPRPPEAPASSSMASTCRREDPNRVVLVWTPLLSAMAVEPAGAAVLAQPVARPPGGAARAWSLRPARLAPACPAAVVTGRRPADRADVHHLSPCHVMTSRPCRSRAFADHRRADVPVARKRRGTSSPGLARSPPSCVPATSLIKTRAPTTASRSAPRPPDPHAPVALRASAVTSGDPARRVLDAGPHAAREELEAHSTTPLGDRSSHLPLGASRRTRLRRIVALASNRGPPRYRRPGLGPDQDPLLPDPLAPPTCKSPCR